MPQWFYNISRGGILPLLLSARQRKNGTFGVGCSAFPVAAVHDRRSLEDRACNSAATTGVVMSVVRRLMSDIRYLTSDF